MKISELLENKGRFIKGPGGVPILTQAQKNRAEERARVKAQNDFIKHINTEPKTSKAPKMAASEIVYKVQDLIANSFPDGDPIDYVYPWTKKAGLTMDDVNAAFAKEYKKKGYDMYKYMADLWDDFASDALADANTMLKRGEDIQDSAFVEVDDSKATKKPNPWK